MTPVVFSLRIDKDLKAALERLAASDDRSLNAYLERVLREHAMDPAERERVEMVLRTANVLKTPKGKRK